MPRQLITIEIEYGLLDEEDEVRTPPAEWPIEGALDHFSDCTGEWPVTSTNRVRQVQVGPVYATEADREQLAYRREAEKGDGEGNTYWRDFTFAEHNIVDSE
jgi:hypothetical protein